VNTSNRWQHPSTKLALSHLSHFPIVVASVWDQFVVKLSLVAFDFEGTLARVKVR
jgi:hypothetical protein